MFFVCFFFSHTRLWYSRPGCVNWMWWLFLIFQQFLAFNPSRRISAFAALSHPYFQSVDSLSRSVYAAQPIPSNKPTMEERTAWCPPPSHSSSHPGGVVVSMSRQHSSLLCNAFVSLSVDGYWSIPSVLSALSLGDDWTEVPTDFFLNLMLQQFFFSSLRLCIFAAFLLLSVLIRFPAELVNRER